MHNGIKTWMAVYWPLGGLPGGMVAVPHFAWAVARHRGDDSERAVALVLHEMEVAALGGALRVRDPITGATSTFPIGNALKRCGLFKHDARQWLKTQGVGIRKPAVRRAALANTPKVCNIAAQSKPASAVMSACAGGGV